MNRIDEVFNRLKKENRKALIPFVSNGDPSADRTVEYVLELERSGADIVEIGVPFSDPLADGPVIQNSYYNALQNGVKVKDVFTVIKKIREKSQIPVVVMVYYTLVFSYGVEKFLKDISLSGADGLIVPDIPLEERGDLQSISEDNSIYLIPLVAPTSRDRIKNIIKGAKGFVYCVSSCGTTGERTSFSSDINEYLETVRSDTNVPICLGFGISSREAIKEVKNDCDGVIVGSAVVRRLSENPSSAFNFVCGLREELDI